MKTDNVISLKGVQIKKSRYYHGRYECGFWGKHGREMKQWLRDTFGENDDMIYASNDDLENSYDAMINKEQLTILLLKWS
jgi:hypothetical protein